MRDLSFELGTVAAVVRASTRDAELETERLLVAVERAIYQACGSRIQRLRVELCPDGVVLSGRCTTYYCKQLAQTAAMSLLDADIQVINVIDVA